MKSKFSIICIIYSSILIVFSCGNDDSNDETNNNQTTAEEIAQIESEAQTGTWVITLYIDSGQDETDDFNGFSFDFMENGTISAVNGSIVIPGTWSVTDSSSGDISSDDDIDFNISFMGPPEFAELTDDWDVEMHSSTRIALIDVSGGGGGTDNLVFERN